MKNKTIAILESRTGEQMADLVRKYGGIPFSAPALAEVPDIDAAHLARMIAGWQLDPPDAFIFQTGVGTKALFATTDSLQLTGQLLQCLQSAQVIARGPKPTTVLRSYKVRIDKNAEDPYTTPQIIEALDALEIKGRHMVVQRYGSDNVELQNALDDRQFAVEEIATYRWSLPADTKPLLALMDALAAGNIDMVCFTSASQAENLFKLAAHAGGAQQLQARLNSTKIASIGPACSKVLTALGIRIDLEASPPKLGPFITAINQAFNPAQ